MIKGRNLALRYFQDTDTEFLYNLYSDESFLENYRLSQGSLNTINEAEQYISSYIKQRIQHGANEEYYVAIKGNIQIGIGALVNCSVKNANVELLLGLLPAFRGKGLGLELLFLLLDVAFNYFCFHKVYLYTYEHNPIAKKSISRLDFIHEGLLREHSFSNRQNKFIDIDMWALLEKDFRTSKKITRLSLKITGRAITQKPHTLRPELVTLSVKEREKLSQKAKEIFSQKSVST